MKLKGIILAVVLALVGAGTALATTEPFTVNLEIRTPITITQVGGIELNLGIVDQGAQTVTVGANTGPHPLAGVGATSAEFTVAGQATTAVAVSLASSSIAIGLTNPVNLTLSTATLNLDGAGAGVSSIFVGGSIVLVAGDAPGTYSNGATLNVIYQ